MGIDLTYVHSFQSPTIAELLKFNNMAVVPDGILGGSDGAIYHCWKDTLSTYDESITDNITHTCWLQIKHVYKLCNNNCAMKWDQPGYDRAYKYTSAIQSSDVHNMNALTARAGLDLCRDETTWAHSRFGEKWYWFVGQNP